MEVLLPINTHVIKSHSLALRPETLENKTIGFLDGWGFRNADGKMSMYPLMRELKNVLIKKYKNINILWVLKDNEHFPAKEDEIKKILNDDVIVIGEAIWGSCTTASVNDAAKLEKLGRPTITIVHDSFKKSASLHAESLSLPDLPFLVEPQPKGFEIEYVELKEFAENNLMKLETSLTS